MTQNGRILKFCHWFDVSITWFFMLAMLATYIAAPLIEKTEGLHSDRIQFSSMLLIIASAIRIIACNLHSRPWRGWKILWLATTLPVFGWQAIQGIQARPDQFVLVLFGALASAPTLYVTYCILKAMRGAANTHNKSET